jgi:hypothetical protein
MTKILPLRVYGCFLLVFCGLPLQGSLVFNSNILLSESIFGNGYMFTVYQDFEGTNPTYFWFDFDGFQLTATNTSLDEGSDWYLTSEGEEFSSSSIMNNAHPVLMRGSLTPPFFEFNTIPISSGVFFLGVNTGLLNDNGSEAEDELPRDTFGWVKLLNSGGTLTMIENAIVYERDGIFVGTDQIVPEPGTFGLFFAAIVGFAVVYMKTKGITCRGRC